MAYATHTFDKLGNDGYQRVVAWLRTRTETGYKLNPDDIAGARSDFDTEDGNDLDLFYKCLSAKNGHPSVVKIAELIRNEYPHEIRGKSFYLKQPDGTVKDVSDDFMKVAVHNFIDPENDGDPRRIISAVLSNLKEPDFVESARGTHDPVTAVTTVSSIEKKPTEWLIYPYIPKGAVTVIGADGGSGKGFLWCNLASAISTGKRSMLENMIPFNEWHERKPGKVLYLSTEDSTGHVIRARLETAGANLDNVLCVDLENPVLSDLYFSSPGIEKIIAEHRPELVIFDPLQSFTAPGTQMNQRNAMRENLNPLIQYGERYGTTFIIIMHTNKMTGVWGRKRLADSADVWDISRSVLIMGYTNDGDERYISHEKSNVGALGDTVLFHIVPTDESAKLEYLSTTDKKDRDFVSAMARIAPEKAQDKTKDAEKYIVEYLRTEDDFTAPDADLKEACRNAGFKDYNYKTAKQNLEKAGKIKRLRGGFGESVKIKLIGKARKAEPVEDPQAVAEESPFT